MLKSFRSKPKYMEINKQSQPKTEDYPADLWTKCGGCNKLLFNKELARTNYVCKECDYHLRISAKTRLEMLVQKDDFQELPPLVSTNPLGFPDYSEKIANAQVKTELEDAVLIGEAKLGNSPCILGIIDFSFMGGSMGSVVGEQITRGFELACEKRLPVVIFSGGGGGARMQEGIFSLLQMAKTTQAVSKHSRAGLLYISILTDPTMGGIYASFASLGDYVLAEPGALIGFAGPKIVADTTKEKLPEGFQKAEFVLEAGMIDQIVSRQNLFNVISKLLIWHE